ncbi:unnamed protein product [Caenorhabditis brenneri]
MNKFAGQITNLLPPAAIKLKNYPMNGYYASGANPNYYYGQNENFRNGMAYYISPQQPNPSAPLYAFVPQPVPYGGYNQHQYAPPPQCQEQQLYQHSQNELPEFEQLQQSPNNNEKLCVPCRIIIKKRLIPVLHELGCLDQLDINGMSHQCATEAIDTDEDKYINHGLETTNSNKNNVDDEIQPSNATAATHQPVETENFDETLPATLATEAAQQQSNEEMEVGTGVLEAATQDFIPQSPEDTVAQDIVEEQKDQQFVLDGLDEMENSDLSETSVIDAPVEEPEFNINEIEFGYTPDPSVETVSSSPGLSIEEVVAFNENEYEEEFPSLTHMMSENTVGTAIISKTLKKKLKKERSIEREEEGDTAAPPAAKKHQRKPKCFITKSDLCAPSDVPMIQFSTSHNSHKMQSKRARSSSQGRGMGCRASKTNGKKQPCFPVTINSNISKKVKADLYVPVPSQKDTTVENGMKYLNFSGQRYMSKAERRQLNEEKAQKQQQATSKIMSLELTSLPPQCNAINDGDQSEERQSLLTSENKSDIGNSISVNSQELEFEKNQDTQILQKCEEASTENSTPDVRNLGEDQLGNDQPPLMYESKVDQVEVLSAKDRKLIFNSNLRLQKKTRKNITENTEGEPSNVPPPANPTSSTKWTETTTTTINSTMNNIEFTSSAPLLPLSTKDDIPDCKHKELDVSQEMRMYWNAIKKCRYAYLAFNIPNVALDLFKDDTTNLGMQILQKLQQNPAVDCRLPYYNKNHSVLWQMRILALQQVENDNGRTMKLFELCRSEQNNINVQDIAALNSLGLSDEHVNRCYPAMVSAIAKTYARREYGTYEITPEYIKQHIETEFDDKYLVHFCNYINRQLRRRYFDDGIAEKNRRETLLSEISQVCDDGSELLQCNTQRCKTAFRGMSQVLKKKGFKEAANLLDFLRKVNSSIITMDYFNCCKVRRDPDASNLLAIWFGYQ